MVGACLFCRSPRHGGKAVIFGGTAAQATQRRGRACRFSSAPRARLGDVLRPEYRPAGHVLPSVSPVGSILGTRPLTTSVAAVIVQRELPDGAVQHRLPTARRSAVARVWAWLRWGGNSTRPDLRTPGHVPSGTRAVRLAFLIRGDDVLCSLALGKSLYPRSPTSQFLPSGRAGRSNSCRAALG